MGPAAAKQGDRVTATDIHICQPTAPGPPVPTPLPFNGILDANLSADVKVDGAFAATVGSSATNTPSHLPPPATSFVVPPTNKGQVVKGSLTVLINKKPAARAGDIAITCNDPAPLPIGTVVVARATVFIGG